MRRAIPALLTLAALALLVSCAGTAPRESGGAPAPRGALPARARYLEYAGAPVDHFTWMAHYDGWQALSDSELVLFMGSNGAYLIQVWAPCGTRGLPYVHHIELTHSIGGTVYVRLDAVRADGFNCPISEIRPIDYRRMTQDVRRQHAAAPAPPQR
ncbi:MAG TPA: DUF6491 family protein [Steroidobacteraceae bacterium]|nr:DUF6491 family protein [Steroidobacteraceae bacterium]